MKKIAFIFGTRPDTIKLAPIIKAFQKESKAFSVLTIATSQHRAMLDQVLSVFAIKPDYDLNIMKKRQNLGDITTNIMVKLYPVLEKEKPDMVVVQGDTSTTFVAALAAFYLKIPVCHAEAGLRTNDIQSPFPEELNRRLTTTITALHLPPTDHAKKALLHERVSPAHIFVTGNSVIDALKFVVKKGYTFSDTALQGFLARPGKHVLLTMHRRENLGQPMAAACRAVRSLAAEFPHHNFIFPVHPNPAVQEVVYPLLSGVKNILLIAPLNYSDFTNLMSRMHFIISDSGGVQEEGPSLGKPVLVLREKTERPEAVKFGTVKLTGLDEKKILQYARKLFLDKTYYEKMAKATNPYGDGRASERTVFAVKKFFSLKSKTIAEFAPVKK
jgi:UDP-N-acetylglucosamine 2-epimerase (non-hydrolysing)